MSGFPVNQANQQQFREWVTTMPEQARRALDANGPKIAAAFAGFANAMQGVGRHSESTDRTSTEDERDA